MCLEQFNTIIIDTFFVFWRPNFLFYSLLFINIGFEKLAMVATLQYPVIIKFECRKNSRILLFPIST